jgi:hypothetical protein
MSRPVTYRFRLLNEAGEDLGPLAARRNSWAVGDKFSRFHGERLTIIRVVATEPHDPFDAYLIVRPSSSAAS